MRPQKFTDVPSTRKPSSLKLRLQAGADEPRPNLGEIQKNHPNPAQPCANSSKRCIKRASSHTPAPPPSGWKMARLRFLFGLLFFVVARGRTGVRGIGFHGYWAPLRVKTRPRRPSDWRLGGHDKEGNGRRGPLSPRHGQQRISTGALSTSMIKTMLGDANPQTAEPPPQ